MLSGKEIKRRMGTGEIIISPYNEDQLNPNSYNVRLAPELLVYEDDILDCAKPNKTKSICIPSDGLVLIPGQLYLGSTVEYTETTGLVPAIDGRSSIGRLGIQIHATAGFGDNGFKGKWTLEISVIKPVRIYANMLIAQLYYETLRGNKKMTYDGKYQGQQSPIESRIANEFIGPYNSEE